jgi:hypothetical protein
MPSRSSATVTCIGLACATAVATIKGESLRTGRSKSCGCLRSTRMLDAMRGRRFGRLTIPLDAIPEFRHRHLYWPCVCDCGVKRVIRDEVLRDGRAKSCGCLRSDPSMRQAMKIRLHNLCGRHFGRLTIPTNAVPEFRHRHLYWPCVCDCGVETIVKGDFLRSGKTVSCGCWPIEPTIAQGDESAPTLCGASISP